MEAVKKFFTTLICDKISGDVSKTKVGAWLSVAVYIANVQGWLDPEMFKSLVAISTGVFGIGIRDLRK